MYSKSNREPISYLCKWIQDFLFGSCGCIWSETDYHDCEKTPHHQGMLILVINHISVPLSRICNLSLADRVFHDHLKLANVAPLFKADDSMIFNNHRPVSILCVISRVFERIMSSRLQNSSNNFNILYRNQFGFRRNHSTYMIPIVLMDEIVHALEKG